MVNINLMLRTLERIEGNPEWNQRRWDSCFAGNACLEAGYMVWGGWCFNTKKPLQGIMKVWDAAQRELDVDDHVADKLFYCPTAYDRISNIVQRCIDAERGVDARIRTGEKL